MIKNERQYRITRAQVARFSDAVRRSRRETAATKVAHPLIHKAKLEALQSQLRDLEDEVKEYELLQSGTEPIIEVESFEELSVAMIKARIAAGMSQKDLAERLGMKEQQIQRYESTDYAGASFSRLAEIVKALGVSLHEAVFVPPAGMSLEAFFKRLDRLGLDKELVENQFLPAAAKDEASRSKQCLAEIIFRASTDIRRVYGWTLSELLGSDQPIWDSSVAVAARFKVPTRANQGKLHAFTIYAHHLALSALKAVPDRGTATIPRQACEVATAIQDRFGELTFKSALTYVWDLGTVVLPLNYSGAFHGVFWRIEDRNVIVLKQRTASEARWLFDLLHELWHAGEKSSLRERTIVESAESELDRFKDEEEQKASRFAGDAVLDGRAEELVSMVVEETDGNIPRFKAAVPRIARRESVSPDSLANYLAFRLSLQGENWWGVANNLQQAGDPWGIARDTFLARCDFLTLSPVDRRLLIRALRGLDEVTNE